MATLRGIEKIEEFSEKGAADLMRWRTLYNFPMTRVHTTDSFHWEADTDEIKKWFQERGANPKTVTESKLEKFEIMRKMKTGEIKPIRKQLTGANEILLFTGRPMGTVFGWLKYTDCPIEIGENNIWSVNAQDLLDWMNKHDIRRGVRKAVPRGFYGNE